jgi:phosphatidylserine/phosphatidylglycerophosphate/cardiolipin synthase-like enzyme
MSSRPIDLLRDLAERAHRRLFLASHIVLDDEVPRFLGRARERGVSVRLFTEIADRADGGLRINTLGLDGQYTGEELARHDAIIRLLARDGVQIQSGPVFSHVKLWVADDRVAVTGSANLTTNSLGTGPSPAVELVQRFDGEVGAALSTVAAWLWAGSNLCCDYDARSGFRISQRLGKAAPPPQHPAVIVGVPGSDHPILNAFRAAIERAERSILLVTMSAYRWADLPGFEAALKDALDRGVSVTLARRAPETRFTECPNITAMQGLGMRVIDLPGLHAKGIVIDDAWTAIFTGNLNPFSLVGSKSTDHVELAVVDSEGNAHLDRSRSRLLEVTTIR